MRKILLLTLFLAYTLFAAPIGKISALSGDATLLRNGSSTPLHTGDLLEKGDTIQTAPKTRLQIVFNDHTVISLGQKTTFRVNDYLYDKKDPKADFSITKGIFKSITGKIGKIAPKHFKLRTKNATIGIRGTTVLGDISEKREMIACSYGKIVVITPKDEVSLVRGEKTYITQTLRAVPPRPLKRREVLDFNLAVEPPPQTQHISDTQPDTTTAQTTQPVETKPDWEGWESESEQNDIPTEQIEETIVQQRSGFKALIQRAGSSTPEYNGKVSGYVQNSMDSTRFMILNDETNAIHLQADLDHASIDGEIRFTSEIGQRWQTDLSGNVNENGTFFFQSDRYSGGGEGELEGERLQKASGSFQLTNDRQHGGITHTATGTFEATKVTE